MILLRGFKFSRLLFISLAIKEAYDEDDVAYLKDFAITDEQAREILIIVSKVVPKL